jgi:hypothetical protein
MKLRNAANSAWITLFQLDGEWSLIPFENGTAAAPSIYFKDSGTDTGIYSPGTDQVAITTGGTTRLTATTTALTSALPIDHPLGTAAAPGITFTGDLNTGIYSPGADQVAISTNGTQRLTVDTAATTSTLPVVHPLGAVGTPSITFTGDLNTGIYSPTADTIAFAEGGVEAMRIDSSGRVGIGATTVGAKLEIATGDGEYTRVNRTGTTGQTGYLISSAGTNVAMFAANDTTGEVRFGGVATNFFPTFWSNNTERARIDTSGRLLVGTSSAQGSSTVTIEQTAANSAPLALRYTSTNDNQIGIDFYRSRSSSAKVESTDPIMRLDAYGYDGSAYRKGASIEAIVDAATSAGDMPCRLVFSTTADGASSPTERMRIGNQGTTTVLPAANLNAIVARARDGASSGGPFLYLGYHSATDITNGTYCYSVATNGNVLNTNGSYTGISDAKLKENIVDASSQWDDLKSIKIRNWNFKEETGHETHRQIGPIAQELEQVCPGLVFETPDRDEEGNETGETTKGVNQSVLYMKAVKALQEAMERIEQLETEMAEVKAQLQAL